MKVYRSTKDFFSTEPIVLTIGTFDGVHAGHLSVIDVLKSKAEEIGGKTALLTFNPHPRVILHPGNHGLKLLNSMEERMSLLKDSGLDFLIVEEFTLELSRLTPLEYVKNLLAEGIKPAVVVIGDDHRFGRNREGDFSALKEMGKMFGFEVIALDAKYVDDLRVSSTKIRKAIYSGEVYHASILLTKLFPLVGKVVEGEKLGRNIGYPTANLVVDDEMKIIPADGTYAVYAITPDSKKYKAMLNIGTRPTVSNNMAKSIEVHILDFEGQLYGEEIEILFAQKIREEKKFDGVEELKNALAQDEVSTRQILARE